MRWYIDDQQHGRKDMMPRRVYRQYTATPHPHSPPPMAHRAHGPPLLTRLRVPRIVSPFASIACPCLLALACLPLLACLCLPLLACLCLPLPSCGLTAASNRRGSTVCMAEWLKRLHGAAMGSQTVYGNADIARAWDCNRRNGPMSHRKGHRIDFGMQLEEYAKRLRRGDGKG